MKYDACSVITLKSLSCKSFKKKYHRIKLHLKSSVLLCQYILFLQGIGLFLQQANPWYLFSKHQEHNRIDLGT